MPGIQTLVSFVRICRSVERRCPADRPQHRSLNEDSTRHRVGNDSARRRQRRTLAVLFCTMPVILAACTTEFDAGFAAYKANEPQKAAALWRSAAERGDIRSQTNLGEMYATGLGVKRDYAQALLWLGKAAVGNYAPAENDLGNLYWNGQGVKQSFTTAVSWFKKAAAQHYALSEVNLGVAALHGLGVTQSYSRALRWFRSAANQGDLAGMNQVGNV